MTRSIIWPDRWSQDGPWFFQTCNERPWETALCDQRGNRQWFVFFTVLRRGAEPVTAALSLPPMRFWTWTRSGWCLCRDDVRIWVDARKEISTAWQYINYVSMCHVWSKWMIFLASIPSPFGCFRSLLPSFHMFFLLGLPSTSPSHRSNLFPVAPSWKPVYHRQSWHQFRPSKTSALLTLESAEAKR